MDRIDTFGPAKLAILQEDGSYVLLDVRLVEISYEHGHHLDLNPYQNACFPPEPMHMTFKGKVMWQGNEPTARVMPKELPQTQEKLEDVQTKLLQG